MDVRNNFFTKSVAKHWSRAVLESLLVGGFKRLSNVALGKWVSAGLGSGGGMLDSVILEGFSNLKDSLTLGIVVHGPCLQLGRAGGSKMCLGNLSPSEARASAPDTTAFCTAQCQPHALCLAALCLPRNAKQHLDMWD